LGDNFECLEVDGGKEAACIEIFGGLGTEDVVGMFVEWEGVELGRDVEGGRAKRGGRGIGGWFGRFSRELRRGDTEEEGIEGERKVLQWGGEGWGNDESTYIIERVRWSSSVATTCRSKGKEGIPVSALFLINSFAPTSPDGEPFPTGVAWAALSALIWSLIETRTGVDWEEAGTGAVGRGRGEDVELVGVLATRGARGLEGVAREAEGVDLEGTEEPLEMEEGGVEAWEELDEAVEVEEVVRGGRRDVVVPAVEPTTLGRGEGRGREEVTMLPATGRRVGVEVDEPDMGKNEEMVVSWTRRAAVFLSKYLFLSDHIKFERTSR
jgi:hypothetical protein